MSNIYESSYPFDSLYHKENYDDISKKKKREIRYAGSTVPACTRKDIPTARSSWLNKARPSLWSLSAKEKTIEAE